MVRSRSIPVLLTAASLLAVAFLCMARAVWGDPAPAQQPCKVKAAAYTNPVGGCTSRDPVLGKCLVGSCDGSSNGWESILNGYCSTTHQAGVYNCDKNSPVTDVVTVYWVMYECIDNLVVRHF
jgi:hypothetical protein